MRNFLRGVLLRLLYPALMGAGTILRGSRERIQLSVIRMNNRLVMAEWKDKKPVRGTKVLLLLPHCLQVSECDVRITHRIQNCKRCGKCLIRDLIEMAEDIGLELFVATGGTIARKVVQDVKPDAIVAVACERDLSSGIVDTYPLPVLGVANERPYGPCLNTRVDLSRVKWAVEYFAGKRNVSGPA